MAIIAGICIALVIIVYIYLEVEAYYEYRGLRKRKKANEFLTPQEIQRYVYLDKYFSGGPGNK